MAEKAPREGTFTRDLRINSGRAAAAPADEAAVLRSPTNHSASLGPSAFVEPVSLAKARQRRDAVAGPRSPAASHGNAAGVSRSTSPSDAISHSISPAYGAEKTPTSKSLLSPTGRRRSKSQFSQGNLRMTLAILTGGVIVFFVLLNHSLRAPVLPESKPAFHCEAPYDTMEPHSHTLHHAMHEGEHGDFPLHSARASIALVTMSDTRKVPLPKNLAYLSDIKPGSLVNILEVVWRNRQEYADRHGYTLVNGTDLVGTDRPPSWYKLKVVESVLDEYDWVFYLDADAWITNPEIPLEAVLPAPGGADFVVTEDATGANAGSWVIRNSDWSREFIKNWWSMDSFIRPPGDTKSGDNDALKSLLATMEPSERARRIAMPPQCALNSYLWRPSFRQWSRWFSSGTKIRSGIWRPGHLLVHLAGWDNYKGLMQLQKAFLNSHDLTRRSSAGLPLPRLSRKHLMPDQVDAVVPKLSTPMPLVPSAGSSGSRKAKASTAEFTTSEFSGDLAAEVAAVGASVTGTKAAAATVSSTSLRRWASALLGDAQQASSTDVSPQVLPSQKEAGPSLRMRAGAFGTGDVATDSSSGGSRSSSTNPKDDSSSGRQGSADQKEQTARTREVAESADYSLATDEELDDLNLPIPDEDEDELKMLDEALHGGEADGDSDSRGADYATPDEEKEEDLVMEIADEVVGLLKERRDRARTKRLGRRGVGMLGGDGGEEDLVVTDGDSSSEAADYEAANSDDGADDSLESEEEDAAREDQHGDQSAPLANRDKQNSRRSFLERNKKPVVTAEADGKVKGRGRSLQMTEASISSVNRAVENAFTALSAQSFPKQKHADAQAARGKGSFSSSPAHPGAKQGNRVSPKGSASAVGAARVETTAEKVKLSWFRAVVCTLTAPQPERPADAEERGGRPYDSLEESPGEDEDYVEHSEDVHSIVSVMPHMEDGLLGDGTAPRRTQRHKLFEMTTDEIDALEEDTQASAEDERQLFGLER